jgi:hypothetical protein
MNIDLIQELLSTSRDRKNEVVDLDNVRSVKKKRLCLCLFFLSYLSKLIIQENGYFTILFTVLYQDNTTLRPKIYKN